MVLVPLLHGTAAIQDQLQPLGPVVGHGQAGIMTIAGPGAVALDVRLVNDVQAVAVAQLVEVAVVGVVAGAHGVDVHALHVPHVPLHQLAGHHAAAVAVELMPVHAVEDDALAVEAHDPVDHLEGAEAHLRPADLADQPRPVGQGDGQLIQHGRLHRPQGHAGGVGGNGHLRRGGTGLVHNHPALGVRQRHADAALGTVQLHLRHQRGAGVVLRQGRVDENVRQMHPGLQGQGNAAVDAAEAPEVLILHPGAGAALEDPRRDAVLARMDEGGHVEAVGGEAVLGIAHEAAVDVQGHGGLHRAEGQHDAPAMHVRLGQVKAADGGNGGVVGFADLGRDEGLPAVPGILGVDVMGRIPLGVLQLELAGDGDLLQRIVAGGVAQQRVGSLGGVHGEVRQPHAVQAAHEGAVLQLGLGGGGVDLMIGAGRQAVDRKHRGIG